MNRKLSSKTQNHMRANLERFLSRAVGALYPLYGLRTVPEKWEMTQMMFGVTTEATDELLAGQIDMIASSEMIS
jgi:hypothetical protein